MSLNLAAEEVASLKGEGFLLQRDKEHFACRVITGNGTLTPEEARKVSDVAEKYGKGTMSLTTRLTVEIPWIKYEDIEKVKEEFKKVGLYTGGTEKKVRPVMSCKGTVCKFGLIDTQGLNLKIHERFYLGWHDVTLPHKFKICVGGCPNNCLKPNLNDIGIMGQRKPVVDPDKCKGCKKCAVEAECKMKAAKMVDGKTTIDKDKCLNCGLCIDKCYFKAVNTEAAGVKVFIGGLWGRTSRAGQPLNRIFTEEEAMDVIEKALLFYKENGTHGERFGRMIDRLGFENVEKSLLGNEIMERKEEILK